MSRSAFAVVLDTPVKAGALVGVAMLCLAGPASGTGNFLAPLGGIAEAEFTHLIRVTLVTMIAIVPVLIGVPLILWRYRRGRKSAAYRPEWTFSKPLEIAMWGVPTAIICILGFWLWQETVKFDPYKPLGANPLQVQVIGLDWKWLFIYPEQGIASVGEMAIPVGRPVSLRLTTDTVMQSFMVSALAGQIYAMAGMETQLNFIADRPGTALGQNTQYSGDGFAKQKFTLRALPEADWKIWVSEAHEAPLELSTRTYERLARRGSLADARAALAPGQNTGPLLFSSVQPDLFKRIIQRYHDGTPVTTKQQPGAPAYHPGGEHD
jgi:cytochrome o ubiquinol oxidase subunit 2